MLCVGLISHLLIIFQCFHLQIHYNRLKRSGSQDFHERERDQFKRGGVRATATARLGWSRDVRSNEYVSMLLSSQLKNI